LSSTIERWRKLEKEFYNKNRFDVRKVPDIYDCIKYDMLHNQDFLQLEAAPRLYAAIQPLASYINPQEYGLTAQEKRNLGIQVCQPLMKKILYDLRLATNQEQCTSGAATDESVHRLDFRYATGIDDPSKHVRSRLYFTSESHIQTLLNILRYANYDPENPNKYLGLVDPAQSNSYLDQTSEYNYLTHIVFRLFENLEIEASDPRRFRVELLISPGSSTKSSEIDISTHSAPVKPLMLVNRSLCLQEVEEILAPVCS